MSLVVEVENLSYTYEDGTQALTGVSFTLNEGATAALLGADGCRKDDIRTSFKRDFARIGIGNYRRAAGD